MVAIATSAQEYRKMSAYVKKVVTESMQMRYAKGASPQREKKMVVFVKGPETAVEQFCLSHQKDIHICMMGVNDIISLSEDARVVRIEGNVKKYSVSMDLARNAVDANKIHSGTGLPKAFDGKDVVVGVVDIGIDYKHPAFRSAKDNRLRIVRAWDTMVENGQTELDHTSSILLGGFYNTEEAILRKGSSRDAETQIHGTHTTSIAAGTGYDSPYGGVAPEADIYSVAAPMGDNDGLVSDEYAALLEMVPYEYYYEQIFNYADSVGKPCVINFSAGTIQDMTDSEELANEYLSRLVEKPGHIIVAAAGNSGQTSGYMPKGQGNVGGKLKWETQQAIVNVCTKGKLKLHITKHSENIATTKTIDLDFLPGNTAEESPTGLKWYDHAQPDLCAAFKDILFSVFSGNDSFDKTKVGYDIFFIKANDNPTSDVYTIEFEGDGVEAEIFCQNSSLLDATNYKATLTGAQPYSGNINSPGSLPSVIAVGNYCTRTDWKNYKGQSYNNRWQGLENEIAVTSSRGPSLHGLTKPDVSAPGQFVCAAISRPYFETHRDFDPYTMQLSDFEGEKYPWSLLNGTSMAAPVVTGTIALWLQAKPTLTKDEAMELIAKTSRHIDNTLSYPNNTWGYGVIDGYKGLLTILNMTGIEGLSTEHLTKAMVRVNAVGDIVITLPEAATTTLPVRLYTTGGALVASTQMTDGMKTLTVPAQHLKGVVAVQVGNLGSTLLRK